MIENLRHHPSGDPAQFTNKPLGLQPDYQRMESDP